MKKKTDFAQRIATALASANLGPTQAARELTKLTGKTVQQQRISHLLSTANSSELTQDIATLTGFNYNWLAHGKGFPTSVLNEADQIQLEVREESFEYGTASPAEFDFASKCTARLSAGDGAITFEHEERFRSHAFNKEWLRKRGIRNIDRLKIFDVEGYSMSPKLEHGYVVGIHLDETTIQHDRIFAFVVDNETRIKRFLKRSDGLIDIFSDNPDKNRYPTETITPEIAENLRIIGRMVWHAGDD